ncbi:transaldolase family protein [Candidatus Latescibacterota bacterium]
MDNAVKRLKALNPETEIWWDSSPLVWPNFVEDFPKSSDLPETDSAWLKNELESMFLGNPPGNWIFSGCTTNPPLSWAVLKTRKEEWNKIIIEKRKTYKGKSKYGLFLAVYFEVIRRGAEKFLPLFEESGGKLGHISGQIDPQLMRHEPAMKEMGEQIADLAPNVMIKVPGSTQGMPIFKHLASKGIATNGTAIFTVSQIMTVAKMVAEGRAIHLKESKTPRFGWRAVCTHMSGRFEDSCAFRGVINKHNLNINTFELRYASEAVIKKCAELIRERNLPIKMLQCSSRLHRSQNGKWFYPHIEMFAGGPLVYTIPPDVFGYVMVYYKDREIVPAWDRKVSEEMIEKLNQVEYFRRGYNENGFDVEEFNEIPTLLENEAEFVGAAKEMIAYVGSFI